LQGGLAHATNGDEAFWEEKFHAANGKAQACTQGALLFFLLLFGGWGGEIFFHFSRLPNVFALCSFQVRNGFPIFSLTFSLHLFTFIPYALENGVLLSPIYVGQMGGTVQLKTEASVLGSIHCLFYLE
jgi:hypothetical protein